MCGIGGILFSKDLASTLQQKIQALSDAQKHRGPDDQGTRLLGQHALCHQRLSLVDAAGGAQPFADVSGRYYIVYNGEIYNHAALREELSATYSFRTRCDTEVVLAAYLTWGEACLQRFNGMFAFLIWDTLTQQAFAARDPLGVKPFVYYQHAGTFYFASEIKALLKVIDHKPAVDPYSLAEFMIAPSLSGGGSQSIFKNINYLEPGTALYFSDKGLQLKKYYQFLWKQSSLGEAELLSQISDALQESVALSMQADVPVGVFLSGGLDSSLLATLAAKHSPQPIEAFTITFKDHHDINFDPNTIVNSDDLPFAKAIAAKTGARFQEVVATHQSLSESLQQLAQINDRIPVWEQEFSQHFLSRAAAQRVKAILVGDAADETNYGYYFLLNEKVNSSPRGLIELFGGSKRAAILSPALQKEIQPLDYLEDQYRQLVQQAGISFGKSEAENIMAMSILVNRRWLARLMHNGDIHTMHYGLEARVPFANRNLLDAIAGVSPTFGFKGGVEKYMLRQVAQQWMEPLFAQRKKSSLPRDPRLGSAYQEILHGLLQPKNEFIDTYLHRPSLEGLSRQHTVSESERMMLFNIICLIHWGHHYAN